MKVDSIEFGFLSPKMIKGIGAIKIEQAELYDPDGYPIDNGLADLHLGVVDPGLRCRTCGGTIGQCLGHFGYLELTKPIVHPLYGKKIFTMLRAICNKCSRIRMASDDITKLDGNKLVQLYKKNVKVCSHCNEKQKDVTFVKPTGYREGIKELSAEEVRQRLEKITDEDAKVLGVKDRPEWFILTILPIPPVTVRPSITLETGERSEDDLTHKLVDIVRINERLRKNLELGAPDFIIADIWELLQYHVSTLMDNEISTLPPARHRSGRALKTLVQRLSKKEGRFRSNLSGKRVNFSARTVISPDPRISISEVGIPEEIAIELTIPDRVTISNREEMRKIILNAEKHPGANYVIRPDGIRKKITEENKEEVSKEIDIGYIVERHLNDGDYVVINRQPSLHRMSMMGHKARIMPHKTIRLSLAVTIPYNADFDGDEMNIHVPQTEEARTETEMLMAVKNHIRSPRYGKPVIACKHDHITGCYMLTTGDKKIDKKEAAELLTSIGVENFEIKDSYTGAEIFSYLFPDDFSITYKSASDEVVEIKNGKLIKGVIDENSLGEKKGRLIDAIEKKYTPEIARDFIDKVSRLSLEVVTRRGFSISSSDEDMPESAKKKIQETLDNYEKIVGTLVKEYLKGKQDKKTGMDPKTLLESRVLQLGGEASSAASDIVKKGLPMNSSVTMAVSGARGSYVNLSQMCAFVGQESLEGERIHRGFLGRTLSHFSKDDLGLKARGFVSNGYKKGLDPFEFFFDAMNSRENLMDKSLHTRHSGYMERRLVTALQDLQIDYDGTVKNSKGQIIQFLVGGDGIDPAKSDGGEIDFSKW
jgi:DNA-directed RNA polymerase subunit A'